jgi:membrane protease YdiL (CAAX protease family)
VPTLLDWLLLVIVVPGLALRAWLGMRALKATPPAERERARRRLWARGILSQWALVAVLVAEWLVQRRPFSSLGLRAPLPWGFGGIVLGLAFIVFMVVAQRRQLARNPDLVERIRARLAPVEPLMPHTRAEWPGFVSLALTAGTCEELLFRGFVWWVLGSVLPSFWLAALAQAILFGLAHAYQGARGIFTTAAVGLFMAGIVWVSGSLWAAMLVHALMDLHAGDMATRVFAPEPRV